LFWGGRDVSNRLSRLNRDRALIAYLLLWSGSTAYLAATGGDWIFPIASFLIFGLGLGGLVWLLTRKMNAPPVPVAQPQRQSLAFFAYIVVYAVLLVGIVLGWIKQQLAPGEMQDLAVLAFKLLIHVGIPVLIISLLGGQLGPLFDTGFKRHGFWRALLILTGLMFALLALVSPSLKQIGALNIPPAAALIWVIGSWAWMSVEAGLCEEFLFRAGLQSRLTAWLASPATAILATSIIFALCYWPGLYL